MRMNKTAPSLSVLLLVWAACTVANVCYAQPETGTVATHTDEERFVSTMRKHLDAVSNRDLATLQSTLSPDGKMQLILPDTEIMYSAEAFMNYHEEWFQDTTWTFETRLLNTEIGEKIGMAITEIVYREPDRNGKPYFNRMTVSYVLKKVAGQWYVIKDHASSIEKSAL